MDSLRIEAYLRSACSVLNFDIGELWVARRLDGQSPTLKFIQLYTSPTYTDFHNLLIRPICPEDQEEEKHRFSPIICRCVCDGGQMVWANTRTLEGLVRRTDMPLNTAVGMPICSVGSDLCILVLFAVKCIPMTPNSIEFLLSIARAASTGNGGFVPASLSTTVTAAKTEQFVGLWDMEELLETYSADVAFRLLPIGKLQAFMDHKEMIAFIEVFEEFKQVRDCSFQLKQLESLQPGRQRKAYFIGERPRSSSITSEGSAGWYDDTLGDSNSSSSFVSPPTTEAATCTAVVTAASSSQAKSSLSYNVAENDIDSSAYVSMSLNDKGPGAFSLKVDKLVDMEDEPSTAANLLPFRINNPKPEGNKFAVPIDSRKSYRQDSTRFHEFLVAILGMTVFDAGELWFVSEKSAQPELYVVAALYRDNSLYSWTTQAKELRLQIGEDIPGQVLKTAQPYWDEKYCSTHAICKNVRSALAMEIGIQTAFGVPLPGPRGVSGVLVLYSKMVVEAEPLMVSLVQKAAQILSAGELDQTTLAVVDIESIVYNPNALLGDWIRVDYDSPTKNQFIALDKTVVKVNLMGSHALRTSIKSRGFSSTLDMVNCSCPVSYGCNREFCRHAIPPTRKRGNDEISSYAANLGHSLVEGSTAQFLLALGTDPGPFPKKRERNASSYSSETSFSSLRACKVVDCGQITSHRSPYCLEHAGARRCQHPECTKCAQGATRFCIAHGGGRRCTFAGCNKGARDKLFCAAHGGGECYDCNFFSIRLISFQMGSTFT